MALFAQFNLWTLPCHHPRRRIATASQCLGVTDLVRLTCTMPRGSDPDVIRYALGAIPENAPSLRTLKIDSYGSSSGFELSDHQMPYLHALSLGFKTASLCQ